MKKIAIAILSTAFAAAALSAPALAKKKKAVPGKCGTMMYFDTKSKSCKSKG